MIVVPATVSAPPVRSVTGSPRRTDNPLGPTRVVVHVTHPWTDLFERAAAYETSEAAVSAALAGIRDADGRTDDGAVDGAENDVD